MYNHNAAVQDFIQQNKKMEIQLEGLKINIDKKVTPEEEEKKDTGCISHSTMKLRDFYGTLIFGLMPEGVDSLNKMKEVLGFMQKDLMHLDEKITIYYFNK